jgi:hypothetical protein
VEACTAEIVWTREERKKKKKQGGNMMYENVRNERLDIPFILVNRQPQMKRLNFISVYVPIFKFHSVSGKFSSVQ